VFFYVGTIWRISLSSDDFYSDRTLMLGLIHVEFFNILMFRLNKNCPERRTSSIELRRFCLKTETQTSLRNVVFEIKTGQWIVSGNIFAFHKYST
jgi:hypothetical protein